MLARMKTHGRALWLTVCMALLAAAILTGCEYDDDDDFSHRPPAGKGSLIVDNRTASDIAVYADGARLADADDLDDSAYDLDPGVRRILLDERGGDGTFRGDVDIIEGRVTVIDVRSDPFDATRFDIAVFLD